MVESVVTSSPPEVTVVEEGDKPVVPDIVTVSVVKDVFAEALDATPLLSL